MCCRRTIEYASCCRSVGGSVSEAARRLRMASGRKIASRTSAHVGIVGEGVPRPGSLKEHNGPMRARRHVGRTFEEGRWGLRLLSSGEYMLVGLQSRERVCPRRPSSLALRARPQASPETSALFRSLECSCRHVKRTVLS